MSSLETSLHERFLTRYPSFPKELDFFLQVLYYTKIILETELIKGSEIDSFASTYGSYPEAYPTGATDLSPYDFWVANKSEEKYNVLLLNTGILDAICKGEKNDIMRDIIFQHCDLVLMYKLQPNESTARLAPPSAAKHGPNAELKYRILQSLLGRQEVAPIPDGEPLLDVEDGIEWGWKKWAAIQSDIPQNDVAVQVERALHWLGRDNDIRGFWRLLHRFMNGLCDGWE